MKKKVICVGMAVLMAAALTACEGAGESKSAFTNESDFTFNAIYVSASSTEEWSENALEDVVLEKGDAADITFDAEEGSLYDIKVVDDTYGEWIFSKVPLDGSASMTVLHSGINEVLSINGGETEIIGLLTRSEEVMANPAEIAFYNDLGMTMEEIYICETGAKDIGVNGLETQGTLEAQAECEITVEPYESYDVYVIDADGNIWYFEKVVLDDAAQMKCGVSESGEALLTVNYYHAEQVVFTGSVM